jgi:tetratricopeptide (TPR) repeat protein
VRAAQRAACTVVVGPDVDNPPQYSARASSQTACADDGALPGDSQFKHWPQAVLITCVGHMFAMLTSVCHVGLLRVLVAPAWAMQQKNSICCRLLQGAVGRNAAQQCYLEALRQDVLYAPAWRGLGDLLREGGEMVQALSCYQEAVRLRPCYAGRQPSSSSSSCRTWQGVTVAGSC